jgi:hypothetical protein
MSQPTVSQPCRYMISVRPAMPQPSPGAALPDGAGARTRRTRCRCDALEGPGGRSRRAALRRQAALAMRRGGARTRTRGVRVLGAWH